MARKSNDYTKKQQVAEMEYRNPDRIPKQCQSCPHTNLSGEETYHTCKSPSLYCTQNSTLGNVYPTA